MTSLSAQSSNDVFSAATESEASSELAQLDRGVRLEKAGEEHTSIMRASDLRDAPAYVLLGEPGSGKSSVLDTEARAVGVKPIKVQAFLNGEKAEGPELFLDGLDEYRADGAEGEKIYKLAAAIATARPNKWRLSCRSEDWRKAADLEAFSVDAPKVAHLLPLDEEESAQILASLREADPAAFLERARQLGAHGFLDNPLSLKLLHTAVGNGGAWPRTRYELFSRACDKLAHDINPVHRVKTGRPSPASLLRVTERASLFMLLNGARALWRSNAPPEGSGYLSAFDIGADERTLNAALDTTLFRGEGEAFEPLHRTIAEFLGARELAFAVVGSKDRAALPMSRAHALISGIDGAPPSELRGLFAWYAVHLANLGRPDAAAQLVAADAFSVLAYGDASALPTPLRRDILNRLHVRDPYFRMSEDRITALGGLAGEDLAADFAAIINNDDEQTQRLMTVLDALKLGLPVRSLEPTLRETFSSPSRPEWVRRRTAEVLQHYAADETKEQRRLFDQLGTEAKSIARNQLRVRLLGQMPTVLVNVDDVKSVIADYADLHAPNFVGILDELRRMLEAAPMPDLFSAPISTWLSEPPDRQPVFEVRSLLEEAFQAVVSGNPGASAAQVWTWIGNKFERAWLDMPKECAASVAAWIDVDPQREIDLFDEITKDHDNDTLWRAAHTLNAATHRRPSDLFFATMMDRRAAATDIEKRLEWSRLAATLAFWSGDAERYWLVYDALDADPQCEPALLFLTRCEIEEWRIEDAIRSARHRREKTVHRYQNVAILSPLQDGLRAGVEVGQLDWGADRFFSERERKGHRTTGLELLSSYVNDDIVEAIRTGWIVVAQGDLCGVSVEMLGEVAAKGTHYVVEAPAMAGLVLLVRDGAPVAGSLDLAIVALRNTFRLRDKDERARLWTWARDRLSEDLDAGSTHMVRFWLASLGAGATKVEELWRFREDKHAHPLLAKSISALLQKRPPLTPEALRETLVAATETMQRNELSALADAASDGADDASESAALWRTLRYALGETGAEALALNCDCGFADCAAWKDLLQVLAPNDDHGRVVRARDTIEVLGSRYAPQDRWGERENTVDFRLSEAVRGAIVDLTKIKTRDATNAFAALVANRQLSAWQTDLRHAAAGQARARRDDEFRHPAPEVLRSAMDGGAPANPQDLKAVVLEELQRLARELHTGPTSPWKGYWNRDSHGRPTEPLVENECRNHLLERLDDRLKPYGIAAALAEVTLGDAGRTDILTISHNGRALPIEAKRHDHPDLWSAPLVQLGGYAVGSASDSMGIYLVFWFGADWRPTPKRADNMAAQTAADVLALITRDLQTAAEVIEVVVFDVAKPV